MKKALLLVTIAGLFLVLGVCAGHAQPMAPGMMGQRYAPSPNENWNYCPYCGNYIGPQRGYGMGPGYGYGMGPGMMGGGMMGRGYGGYGMMGPGYGYGPGPQSRFGPQYQQPMEPLDRDQVKQQVENYLKSTRNPNLKMGKIEEKGKDYEVDIKTRDGSLVDKILVNKDTGWMRSAY